MGYVMSKFDTENIRITPIPAFQDNYFWVLEDTAAKTAILVDPGDAEPVLKYFQQTDTRLIAILITHHHMDHIGGISSLVKQNPQVTVYGPLNESIPGVNVLLQEGDRVSVAGFSLNFNVIDVPGHTSGHIAYYTNEYSTPLLFCGDTLFAAGCGRLFEGTAEQMYRSLEKIAALPGNTRVFCAHEYTMSNIAFAKQVEPENKALIEFERNVKLMLSGGRPSLPSNIAQELAINPFLRSSQPAVIKAAEKYAGRSVYKPVDAFGIIRRWKDSF